jgi:pimeloyl-ACP methyl ester carboxylesterase
MNKVNALIAAVVVTLAGPCLAATTIPPGKWSFVFTDAQGRADRPIRVYTYRPKACDTKCPIQFVMHGMKRNASAYRDHWEPHADRYKVILVAPEFLGVHWPKAAAYNLGDLAAQANREKWTFSAIEHIFDELRDGHAEYRIFGHSAGGQFVQRMAFFRPDNRASVMVAANPGWYTMPEWRKDKGVEPFPYSLLNSRVGVDELRQGLAKRFVLLLGEKDDDPDDENLSKAPGAVKQGETRVERGENFFKASTAAAAELNVKLGWQLIEVPDVAHDGASMSRIAAETLYEKRR